jgi:hypothetical protein
MRPNPTSPQATRCRRFSETNDHQPNRPIFDAISTPLETAFPTGFLVEPLGKGRVIVKAATIETQNSPFLDTVINPLNPIAPATETPESESMQDMTSLEADVPTELEERLVDYCAAHGVTPDEVVATAILEFLDGRDPEVEY